MILDTILRHKKREVKSLKGKLSLEALKKKVSSLPHFKSRFIRALKQNRPMAVIAEIKKRSPSKGLLSRDFDPVRIARDYQRHGAAALSVLTDKKFFGGSPAILKKVKAASRLPVLRKDFTIDEYQLYESRLLGADAVLLIAKALSGPQMKRFYGTATRLGLDVLFEAHDESDLRKILPLKPRLIGINNRDLRDFHVDLAVTARLAPKAKRGALLVSESGIVDARDIRRLKNYGVRAVLVGESLMKDARPGAALKRLLGKPRGSR